VGSSIKWSRRALCGSAAVAALMLAIVPGSAGAASAPTPPFTQCPAIGAAPSCDILLVVNPDQTISVVGDSSVGPYDGSDDTLVGIVNNSGSAISAITVSGPGSGLAGFDGDGICTYATGGTTGGSGAGYTGDSYCDAQQLAGTDPEDYSGPDNSFTLDPNSADDVEVDFTAKGLAAGASSFFSLEGALTAAVVTAHKGGLKSARYVALGDSVPYGHGLANPDKNKENGLSADQPPSTQAWPSVVDAGLAGLAPLQDRQDGCDLVGSNGAHFDQLAVSGAPSIDNKWTGSNSNCHYPRGVKVPPHTAVFPDEVSAANLKNDPPGLVTIQAGADDIDFAACLESLLQIPPNPFTHVENCVDESRHGYSLTPKVRAELASLAQGLSDAIQYIKTQAPSAQIVLVGYYQIIPAANASMHGTTFVCRDLRFSSPNSAFRTSIRGKADYLQQQLNNTISTVASQNPGVAYFDISNLFNGHELCTSNTWLFSGAWDAAHPNATGQQQIGQAVIADCEKLADHCIG
jgi:lysophospholipase L1-like esterase